MQSRLGLLHFIIRSELYKRFPRRFRRPTFEDIRAAMCGPGMPFEIEQVNVEGREIRSWKKAAPSMAALVGQSREYGDDDFIIYGEERLSYAEHYRRVAAVASAAGRAISQVNKGDRVAIAMRNFPEWSIAFWAAAAAGAVVVPLNAWWTRDELEYGLNDSGTTVVFVDEERLHRMQQIDTELPLQHIVTARCDPVIH